MRKNIIIGTAAVAALAFGGTASAQADAPISVDSAVEITSGAPVPGGFTAGTWAVSNLGATDSIPAGTTYIVKFSGLVSSMSNIGATTLTPAPELSAKKIANGTYRVTVEREITPGHKSVGLWSMADSIFIPRATVTVSLESLSRGAVDTDASNDAATYNNHGKGF